MTYAINYGDFWAVDNIDPEMLAHVKESPVGRYIVEVLTLEQAYDKYADRFPVKLHKEAFFAIDCITQERLLNFMKED